jgi:Putative transposase
VLAYPSRYTHRVAISNRGLISADDSGVTFKWKDCRIGFQSGAALATVVGVLIEVPVMLSVVKIVNSTQVWYEARAGVRQRMARDDPRLMCSAKAAE